MPDLPQSLQTSKEGTKTQYRRLGKSGLQVSVPIVGCMSYGTSKWQPWVLDEEKSIELLWDAYQKGVNTWDTANAYSGGLSEVVIAKAIKKHKIPREKVVILTKCFFGSHEDDPTFNAFALRGELVGTKDYVNQTGLSRGAIFNQVEASLKRLETDYIDLLQIHRFDPNTPIEETMEALHDLVRMGKVRYIGASSMWAYQLAMMQAVADKNGWTKFVSMQNYYNLLYREEEREMIAYCNLTGVGLIPWGPLCRGHLARSPDKFGETTRSEGEKKSGSMSGPHFEDDLTVIKRVEEIAKKHDWPMAHVSLAWINSRVTSPIIGISSPARLDEALGSLDKTLTEEEAKYIEEPYKPKPVTGHM